MDRQVLTTAHMYAAPEVNEYYDSGKYDPEGLLGERKEAEGGHAHTYSGFP